MKQAFTWLLLALLSVPLMVVGESLTPPKPLIWSRGYYERIKESFPPTEYSYMDRQSETRDLHEEGFLTPRERDAVFHRAGLDSRLSSFDELSKDLLVGDARYYSLSELHQRYPTLKMRHLKRLKTEVEKIK